MKIYPKHHDGLKGEVPTGKGASGEDWTVHERSSGEIVVSLPSRSWSLEILFKNWLCLCSSPGFHANADQGAFRIHFLCQLCLGLWGRLGFRKVSQLKRASSKKDKTFRFDDGAVVPKFYFFRDGLGLFFPGQVFTIENNLKTFFWLRINIRASLWKMVESQTRSPRSRGVLYSTPCRGVFI